MIEIAKKACERVIYIAVYYDPLHIILILYLFYFLRCREISRLMTHYSHPPYIRGLSDSKGRFPTFRLTHCSSQTMTDPVTHGHI